MKPRIQEVLRDIINDLQETLNLLRRKIEEGSEKVSDENARKAGLLLDRYVDDLKDIHDEFFIVNNEVE